MNAKRDLLALVLLVAILSLPANILGQPLVSAKFEFGAPAPVTIQGLPNGVNDTPISSEEPFLSRDCRFLFFNTHQDENNKDLHFAEWIDGRWLYRGELGPDINTEDDVEGNPAMDRAGNFYFIDSKLDHMVNSCKFHSRSGKLSNCKEVSAVPAKDVHLFGQEIHGNMGIEVSDDGQVLFFDRAVWGLRLIWLGTVLSSDIHFMTKNGDGWNYDEARSGRVMHAINSDQIEYAESLSPDLKEIYFTRLNPGDVQPEKLRSKIMYSYRESAQGVFPEARMIESIGERDFVEGPALSCDGQELYYHRLSPEEGKFRLFKVSRRNG